MSTEELQSYVDRLFDSIDEPAGPHTGRRDARPRVLGQAVEPSTANVLQGMYARDATYIDALQEKFDDIKAGMFRGIEKLASASSASGMVVHFGMTRAQIDMHVLQHMARGN